MLSDPYEAKGAPSYRWRAIDRARCVRQSGPIQLGRAEALRGAHGPRPRHRGAQIDAKRKRKAQEQDGMTEAVRPRYGASRII